MRRALFCGAVLAMIGPPLNAEMIHLFARKGDATKVMAEIDKGIDVDLPSTRNTTEVGVSPLFIAAKFGKVDAVRALIEAGADVNAFFQHDSAPYPYGTPLHVAAAWGQLEAAELLLEAGADPDRFHRLIGTPLQAAREGGHVEIAALLLTAGATPKTHADPVNDLIRDADVDRGEELAGTCRTCHSMTTEPIDGSYPSPPLWGVVGRDVAALEFDYSDAMSEEPGNWTYEALNSYIASPYRFVPGTKMFFGGVESPTERAAIIAYLRTLSDEPIPLP